jgi:hypothetical protein
MTEIAEVRVYISDSSRLPMATLLRQQNIVSEAFLSKQSNTSPGSNVQGERVQIVVIVLVKVSILYFS